MPFTYALDPIALQLGPLAIRWYSLVYVAGFLLTYAFLRWAARTKRIKRLTEDGADTLTTALIVGMVVGSRLAYVLIYNPAHYISDPLEVLMLWHGGLSFHGGFLGGVAATYWFSRRFGVDFYELVDLIAVPGSLTLAFGRVANLVNGELVGRVTNIAWCVNYPGLEGCRHPSQLYEAGKNLVIFAILAPTYLYRDAYSRLRRGTIFWGFILLYGVGRFLTNFYRAPDPTDPLLGGLLIGQWLSLAMAVLGAAMLMTRRMRR